MYIEYFPYCLFLNNSQMIGCEDHLRNDLYCVSWGIKVCSIQSIYQKQKIKLVRERANLPRARWTWEKKLWTVVNIMRTVFVL